MFSSIISDITDTTFTKESAGYTVLLMKDLQHPCDVNVVKPSSFSKKVTTSAHTDLVPVVTSLLLLTAFIFVTTSYFFSKSLGFPL